MKLYCTSFSPRTADEIRDILKKNPAQVCNTPEAYEGLVMEFVTKQGGPVGSLDECYEYLPDNPERFEIQAACGNIIVVTRKAGFGEFVEGS